MEPALRACCPGIRIGTILIQRDEKSATKAPDESIYNYTYLPADIASRYVLLLDPMLATAGTVCRAIRILHDKCGVPYDQIICVHVIASRTGIYRLLHEYPEVRPPQYPIHIIIITTPYPHPIPSS